MSGRMGVVALIALLGGLVVVACSKSKAEATSTAAAPAAEARKYFKQNCEMCHGADGKGDGPGAANLSPKPQDYTDPKWQAKVKDSEIKKAILEGGRAVGKSAIMPSHPDLDDKPKVVDALVKIVRGFRAK